MAGEPGCGASDYGYADNRSRGNVRTKGGLAHSASKGTERTPRSHVSVRRKPSTTGLGA